MPPDRPSIIELAPTARRKVALLCGLAGCIALALLIALLSGPLPTRQQECEKHCAASGKRGQIVYTGKDPGQVRLTRDNSACRCL